jgi:type IV pilus assembly protein PilB
VARERLGELLLRSGVLTQAQLVSALREQARTGVRLGQILVDHGLVEEVTLYDALAKMTGLERFNLRTVILERSALNLVTGEWAVENGIVPFKVDVQARTLHVAVTDPTNLKPVDDLAFRMGLKIKMFVASETELERVVRHHFHGDSLDRDPRSVRRPGGPQPGTADIDESQIMRGMDSMRDEVLKQQKPNWDDTSQPGFEQERAVLAQLKPIYDAQEEAARALRAIFELCVTRGIIRREEYLERLKRTPD